MPLTELLQIQFRSPKNRLLANVVKDATNSGLKPMMPGLSACARQKSVASQGEFGYDFQSLPVLASYKSFTEANPNRENPVEEFATSYLSKAKS